MYKENNNHDRKKGLISPLPWRARGSRVRLHIVKTTYRVEVQSGKQFSKEVEAGSAHVSRVHPRHHVMEEIDLVLGLQRVGISRHGRLEPRQGLVTLIAFKRPEDKKEMVKSVSNSSSDPKVCCTLELHVFNR